MQEFDFILLLNKRFTGEIDARESALLDAWIGASSENAQLAEQYRQVWEQTTERQKKFDLDLDAEYSHLLTRLDLQERPLAKVVPIGGQLLRVAAAVAFLLLATYSYWQYTTPVSNQIVENAGKSEKRLVELPDGSRVWLRQNATMQYPETFSGNERRVKLTGEAYFEVAHQAEKPFRVELAQGGLVEVLGTQFNVQTATAENAACILVREGKVRFSPNGNSDGVILAANDKAVCRPGTSQIRISKLLTFNELAWQTGQLEFNSTALSQVVADLEQHFGVQIELQNAAVQHCRYTAVLHNQPLSEVLESLALIYRFDVSQPTPGQYRLAGGICK